MTKLITAIDTRDLARAKGLAADLDGCTDAIKLGLEFTYAHGFDNVRSVAQGRELFLDLKLHDIPNTVAGGISSLAPLAPRLLTIHASGGRAMIKSARAALETYAIQPELLAVTVLTSTDQAGLAETGVPGSVETQVLRLAEMALDAGASGLVCAATEIAALRRTFGSTPVLVVPGIRPEGADHGDQARVMTPQAARDLGADWIVVGRPITQAPSPADAARAIQAALAA